MIQIVLLILKIIGITILAVLGLVVLLLALVLFVPVFYRVRIIHNPEKTQVKAKVTYLFPLLLVTVQYFKQLSYKVRIFGFALLSSDKPKKEKSPKTKKAKVKKSKKKPKEEKPEIVAEFVTEPIPEEVSEVEERKAEPEPAEEDSQKQGFFEKIRCKIQKIRETISKIINKIKKLLHQKEELQRILEKPETKRVLRFAWDKLKRLLKHIFPRKIKGYIAYGADNPATTGQVLGILGVVYARTGQLLEIRPNFMEKQLECDIELKGHILVFNLLVIALKVFFNQELRQLIAEFKNIKETE